MAEFTRLVLVGTQRSGSNLLRLMLAQCDGVFAPPSAHEVEVLTSVGPFYGDLRSERACSRLVADMIELVRLNVLEWPENSLPTTEEVLEQMRVGSVLGAYVALMDAAAARVGSSTWVSKNLELYQFLTVQDVEEYRLAPIHLVRDGRDVGLSFLKAPIGPKTPEVAGTQWRMDQEGCRALRATLAIRYEDLLAEPEEVFRAIGAAHPSVGRGNLKDFYLTSAARHAASRSNLWSNLDRPLMRNNAGRYRDTSAKSFVEAFERVAFTELLRFGYQPLYALEATPLSAQELEVATARDSLERRRHRLAADSEIEQLHVPQQQWIDDLRGRATRAMGAEGRESPI